MMDRKVTIEIPLGYKIVRKRKRIDVWEAERILTSRKQRYYTEAIRKNTDVDLIGSYIVCPFCNNAFAVNDKYSAFSDHTQAKSSRISKTRILEWSGRQLSIFDDGKEKTLYISSPVEKCGSFKCPNCKAESEPLTRYRHVEIIMQEKKIIIKSEIVNFDEIFALKWNNEDSISIDFPMYEVVIFDFKKGRIYAGLENNISIKTTPKDITNDPDSLKYGAVYNTIIFNRQTNRILKRMFSDIWQSKLPFSGSNITVLNFFRMTMFVGYDTEFYDHIPYRLKSFDIDDSFLNIVRQLHNINDVELIYVNSELPDVKSVRKIFFERAGLFFYLKEAEQLFSLINDYNLFCKLLKSELVFEVLLDLHIRPGVIGYLRDYVREKGAKRMIKVIIENWRCIREFAIDYNSMNETGKKAMRESWKKDVCSDLIVQRKAMYSIPMHRPIDRIYDCNIDGYDFFWLRSSNDYVVAGDKLKNCLEGWHADGYPVVCVKKQDKYVAAIEISEHGVEQAKGYNNDSLDNDTALYSAFQKWLKKYNISVVCYCFDYDGEVF